MTFIHSKMYIVFIIFHVFVKGKLLVSESLWSFGELYPKYNCTFVSYFPHQRKSLQVS